MSVVMSVLTLTVLDDSKNVKHALRLTINGQLMRVKETVACKPIFFGHEVNPNRGKKT